MNLKEEIKKLSPAERILLIEEVWDNLEVENKIQLSEEKKAFLDERLDAIEQGKATFVTLEEIKARFNQLK